MLPHEPDHVDSKDGKDSGRDITVLDWHPASTYLASGTFDGVVRVWDCAGEPPCAPGLRMCFRAPHVLQGSGLRVPVRPQGGFVFDLWCSILALGLQRH